MESEKKITIGCTSPLAVAIFIVFFIAKIYDKIDWSWWWVFSPLWIPIAFVAAMAIILGILYIGAIIIAAIWK